VLTADGHDLNELLVSAGLARIYGTRTPLPDGRDSRTYLARLHELEMQAKAARRGAWSKSQP
jgi:endonuclease YncB( thermonuclease family)